MKTSRNHPVGIFDSGVGGLTVLRELVKQLPSESFIYYADSNNCPYGSKNKKEVTGLVAGITDFLLLNKCKLIVVACNTATAAAIDYLRAHYSIPFIGMEPAVKPAALNTRTGKIGILATHGTFQGKLFKETSKIWAGEKHVMVQAGEGLVELVESGKVNGKEVDRLLRKYIMPMLENNVDQIVLGCTHYPFLRKAVEKIVNGRAAVLDTAPAIARRTYDILREHDLLNRADADPVYKFFVNGKKDCMQKLLISFFKGKAEFAEL